MVFFPTHAPFASILRVNVFGCRFLRNTSGATAIEYALITLLISIAAIVAFRVLGNQITTKMTSIAGEFDQ